MLWDVYNAIWYEERIFCFDMNWNFRIVGFSHFFRIIGWLGGRYQCYLQQIQVGQTEIYGKLVFFNFIYNKLLLLVFHNKIRLWDPFSAKKIRKGRPRIFTKSKKQICLGIFTFCDHLKHKKSKFEFSLKTKKSHFYHPILAFIQKNP